MKTLPIYVAALAVGALIAGCQKREPTRPGQPTVSNSKERSQCPDAVAHSGSAMAGFRASVRRRHFDLP